jgi:hypothetical protein
VPGLPEPLLGWRAPTQGHAISEAGSSVEATARQDYNVGRSDVHPARNSQAGAVIDDPGLQANTAVTSVFPIMLVSARRLQNRRSE